MRAPQRGANHTDLVICVASFSTYYFTLEGLVIPWFLLEVEAMQNVFPCFYSALNPVCDRETRCYLGKSVVRNCRLLVSRCISLISLITVRNKRGDLGVDLVIII